MHIHCFQHVLFETPGFISEWAANHHHAITFTFFFEDKYTIPTPDEYDCLLILGGDMNVDEEEKFPWLKKEKSSIRQAIEKGKKVIGICLGSQLIIAALNKKVYIANEKEIGFFPVSFNDEALRHPFFDHFTRECMIFHWHGDTFDLPDGAILIASSKSCKNQAFIIDDNVIGMQFHPEVTKTIIENMLLHDGHELQPGTSFVQTAGQIRSNYNYLSHIKEDLFLLLDKFLAREL